MDKVLKVIGQANMSVAPDTLNVNLKLNGIKKEYNDALDEASKETLTIKDILENIGFDREDVKTSHFKVEPKFTTRKNDKGELKNEFVGYEYTHSMTVSFANDSERLGKVIAQITHCDVKVKLDIRYTVEDTEKVKEELMVAAVNDAKRKAAVLAKGFGVKLKEIQTINYSRDELDFYSGPFDYGMHSKMMTASNESYDFEFSPENIELEDSVNVIWSL